MFRVQGLGFRVSGGDERASEGVEVGTGKGECAYLREAMNSSPLHTHSSFLRQFFPGRLKSQAAHTSSVTIDGGCSAPPPPKQGADSTGPGEWGPPQLLRCMDSRCIECCYASAAYFEAAPSSPGECVLGMDPIASSGSKP